MEIRGVLGGLVLALALAAPAAAQNAQTTGDIRGRTLDAAGEPVPGVLVTARNTETGLERTAITADNGIYVLRLLPPGNYTATAQAIGFATRAFENIRVAIGQSAAVNFELSPQAVEIEELIVSGERAPIDVSDASVTELVTVEQIESLPTVGRDFTDFIALSPQVAVDPGVTTGGQFSIGGQAASQTNLQIDGVDANNAFFGENRGGARIPFIFSLESIEEFQIITNGYDVEYGAYSGGIVNVVTRSGTNELEGTVYGNFRGDALTGRGFLGDSTITDYEVQQFAGRISGPIVRDNAFFLVSADVQRRREPNLPINELTYGASGERALREVDAEGDTIRVADQEAIDELERFYAALENVYGVDSPRSGYNSFSTTNDVLSLFGRVDWNINDAHRLSVRHNYTTYTNDNEFDPDFDDYYGISRSEKLEDHSHSFVTELSSVLGQNTFNVFRFQYATEDRPRNGSELRPALVVRLSNDDLIGYGGTFVSFHNNLSESKYQLINNFTQVFGEHTVKIGAQGLFTNAENEFLPALSSACGAGNQGAGIYCFDSVDEFEAGRASSYQFNVQRGVPGAVPLSEVGLTELAFYIQDELRVTPQLTVTAGLRHDRQWFDDNPTRVFDVERSFGYPSATAPSDNNNISPRVSVAYDLAGDGRSVVRAGAGYFFGRVPLVLGGNVLQSARPVFNLTCAGDVGADPDNPIEDDAPPSPLDYGTWDSNGGGNPTACATSAELSGVPNYTIWNTEFEYPETFKANLGYEGFVAERTKLSLDLIFSRSTNMFNVRNLNLRPAQFTLAGEDDRQIFTPEGNFAPGAANTLGSRVYSDIGDVYVNYNDGRAQSISATVEARHQVSEALNLTAAYTHTRAYDNASLFCCTSSSNFSDPMVGAFGPNDLGDFGDEDRGWGRSDFSRDHAFVFSGVADLPYGFEVAAFWRLQSGRPFTPEVSGDINGDGVRFNDRPYVFAVEDVPLTAADGSEAEFEQRELYASVLANNDCVGEHVGGIIPRNTCRSPWLNLLDMRVTNTIEFLGDELQIQLDLFNVMNGLGNLFCSDDEFREDPSEGACGWGRVTTVSGPDRNLYVANAYNSASNEIRYTVNRNFGRESVVGDGLLLQFQAQIGLKYYF